MEGNLDFYKKNYKNFVKDEVSVNLANSCSESESYDISDKYGPRFVNDMILERIDDEIIPKVCCCET